MISCEELHHHPGFHHPESCWRSRKVTRHVSFSGRVAWRYCTFELSIEREETTLLSSSHWTPISPHVRFTLRLLPLCSYCAKSEPLLSCRKTPCHVVFRFYLNVKTNSELMEHWPGERKRWYNMCGPSQLSITQINMNMARQDSWFLSPNQTAFLLPRFSFLKKVAALLLICLRWRLSIKANSHPDITATKQFPLRKGDKRGNTRVSWQAQSILNVRHDDHSWRLWRRSLWLDFSWDFDKPQEVTHSSRIRQVGVGDTLRCSYKLQGGSFCRNACFNACYLAWAQPGLKAAAKRGKCSSNVWEFFFFRGRAKTKPRKA